MTGPRPLALVHDYLTQQGGAERVVLALAAGRRDVPVHTSLYDPDGTFPEFADLDVRPMALDRVPGLRRHHRAAFPVLAPAFSRLTVDAEVTVCSSSGWAHATRVTGRKVVYCHTPARWLYQGDRYLAGRPAWTVSLLDAVSPPLRRWDVRSAHSAHRYLVNARVVRARVAEVYGIDAEVVPPPVDLDTAGPRREVPGVEPGAYLCVSRLMAYKNVDAVVEAFRELPDERLVVVGSGPLSEQLTAAAPGNVTLVGRVDDDQLRWLYASCRGLVAASYEDFGLTPVEAAAFGKPTVALEWGGFLDTIVDGTTGLYFREPDPRCIAAAVRRASAGDWDTERLRKHAEGYSLERFTATMASVVADERSRL